MTPHFILAGICWMLFSKIAVSQSYFSFPIDSVVWSEERYTSPVFPNYPTGTCYTTFYALDGDTFFNGIKYSKLYVTNILGDWQSTETTYNPLNATYIGAVREDSTRKVFIREKGELVDKIRYDFSLNENDNFFLPAINAFGTPCGGNYKVMQVDSILIQGNYRKRWRLSQNDFGNVSDIWIEGIGSIVGWFNCDITGSIVYQLRCYKEKDELVYYMGSQYFGNGLCHCNSFYVSVNEIAENLNEGVMIYPSITNSKITVELLKANLQRVHFQLYDHVGRLVNEEYLSENISQIDFSTFTNGIYLLRIKTENEVAAFRVVKSY